MSGYTTVMLTSSGVQLRSEILGSVTVTLRAWPEVSPRTRRSIEVFTVTDGEFAGAVGAVLIEWDDHGVERRTVLAHPIKRDVGDVGDVGKRGA